MLLAVGGHVLGALEPWGVRLGTGFAGGVGDGGQEMCGALSGGVLIIGALLGRQDQYGSDLPALMLAARYRRRFLDELGSTQCAELRQRVHAPGGLGSCATLVEQAAVLLLELLAEDGQGFMSTA